MPQRFVQRCLVEDVLECEETMEGPRILIGSLWQDWRGADDTECVNPLAYRATR